MRTAAAERRRGPRARAQLKISSGLKGEAPAEASRSSCSNGARMRGRAAALAKSALNTGGRTRECRVSVTRDSDTVFATVSSKEELKSCFLTVVITC